MSTEAVPTARLQRGRRGTDAASVWVRGLRLRLFDDSADGKPRLVKTDIPAKDVKHLLLTIAQYVDHDGCCFPSFQTLADDTEMSWDSIKRRLADAEYLKLIVRYRRWRDPNGNINDEGRGRETSGEIRFLFDTTQEEIDALLDARRADAGPSVVPDEMPGEIGPPGELGCADSPPQNSELGCADSPPGVGSTCTPQMNPSLEPESPPKPPLSQESEAGNPREEQDSSQGAYDRFAKSYPIPIADVPLTRQLVHGLTADEREDLVLGATGYRLHCKSQDRRAMDADKFIRKGRWVGYVEAGRAAQPRPSPPPPREIPIDSDEGRALLVIFQIAGGWPDYSADKTHIRLRYEPLGAQALALAAAPPQADWQIQEFAGQWAAWSEFLFPIIGRTARVRDHVIGAKTVPNPKGGEPIFAGNITKRGLKAPWPWPPRKDGSHGAPAGELDDESAREFISSN